MKTSTYNTELVPNLSKPSSFNPGNGVAQYYNHSQIFYSLFWSRRALHYGFWEKGTNTLKSAIQNTDDLVGNLLGLNNSDHVLDAGCGIGGSAISLAKKFKCEITGITLSEIQVNRAQKLAKTSDVENLLKFYKKDYLHTGFSDRSFSKIYAIESSCHSFNKYDFLREAYRVLDNKGKIVVVDTFLLRKEFDKKERNIYKNVIDGFALPNLSTKSDFYSSLEEVGFKKIRFIDKLQTIRPSSRRIYFSGLFFYPILGCMTALKLFPKIIHRCSSACISQWPMFFKHRMATYGVFIAEKS